MEDSKYKRMQDEMSRFEAEISGVDPSTDIGSRPIIGANTFGNVQQQLDRAIVPPPPPALLQPFDPSIMTPKMMFPNIPPPPPPPTMMIPAQWFQHPVQEDEHYVNYYNCSRPVLPGPALMPPPPPKQPQPVVLSAAPKIYRKPTESEEKKEKEKKKELLSVPKLEPMPTPVEPTPPPPPPPVAVIETAPKTKKEKKNRKVVRTAGGQIWEDVTLLDWPDDDFRMFCGDLGNDVTDELLVRTFSKYSSFQKAKVIRDKRTNKSKGFGFVSFKDPGDFIKAMKEMDGRYVGSRPIKLRKSTWRNRALDIVRKKEKEKAALLSLLMSGNKS
ncbi:RNA-binding protein 42 [Eumeta japonica]|uniref:RNA-binding protein 42 n=1 Tax=Eumeta variegata TaxID=151549 RepID=A0A4C1SBW5_EUMVA|nr:RNA-binding protein 42 [Eumeta japonica]